MKNNFLTKPSLSYLLPLLIALAGCLCSTGCIPTEEYQRQVNLSAPLLPGSVFVAQTHNGSITVTGAEVSDCNLTATITAKAESEQDAKKLAENVKIKLLPSEGRLTVRIEKPSPLVDKYVSVRLNATVPNQTVLELITHNGGIKITDITDKINGTTHNGGISTSRISGAAKLQTHNGSIKCAQISGDIQLRTHNGGVKAIYSETAQPDSISIVTHNGGINFTAPPNFSANVHASTHNGSIKTDLPITVVGRVGRGKLTGTIGSGRAKLHLETHNGSIKIK